MLNIFKIFSRPKKREYNLGKSFGRFTKWIGDTNSARLSTEKSIKKMIARSRELCQNNPLAIRAKRKYGTAIIGSGIIPKVDSKQVTRLLRTWEPDFDGKETLQGLFRLAIYTIFESGSCFILKRKGDPVSIQILEPDYLDTTRNNFADVKNGIKYDKDGKVLGYYLYENFPGDYTIKNSYKSYYISEKVCKLVFWQERSGSQMGVPFLTQVGDDLKDIEEYTIAEIQRRKVASCFAAFVYDTDSSFDSSGEYDGAEDLGKLSPGRIDILPPGKKIEFSNPPSVQDSNFLRDACRRVATGLGITYEALTGDFSQVNFSSARMGRQEQDEFFSQLQQQFAIPRICKLILQWYIDALFYSNVIKSKDVGLSFTVPRKPFIQPLQDINALGRQIELGLTTPSEAVMAMGKEPEAHWDNLRKDNENLGDILNGET